jgi:hypothetical protein
MRPRFEPVRNMLAAHHAGQRNRAIQEHQALKRFYSEDGCDRVWNGFTRRWEWVHRDYSGSA